MTVNLKRLLNELLGKLSLRNRNRLYEYSVGIGSGKKASRGFWKGKLDAYLMALVDQGIISESEKKLLFDFYRKEKGKIL